MQLLVTYTTNFVNAEQKHIIYNALCTPYSTGTPDAKIISDIFIITQSHHKMPRSAFATWWLYELAYRQYS